MERSIQVNNPADADVWRQVRNDYRNLLVLETAAGRAGESTAMGLITPANLRSAVAQQNKRAYVRGQGDFAELARGGAATMAPLPQSGTAPRQFVRNAGMALPTIMGAALGGQAGDITHAAMGAAAGAAVPAALGKVITSGVGRRYLTNQLLAAPLEVRQAALGPALGGAANQLSTQRSDPELIRSLRVNAMQ